MMGSPRAYAAFSLDIWPTSRSCFRLEPRSRGAARKGSPGRQPGVFSFKTHSAAITPRYCASSKMEKPLRSEWAKWMLPKGRVKRWRASLHMKPGRGLTIVWPHRMMSIVRTRSRISGCGLERSARMKSAQVCQSVWSRRSRSFAGGEPVKG